MMKTIKDNSGRVWKFCDSEGAWSCGEHVIGCGRKNGSKWQVWQGPCKDYYEFKTLREAMQHCR